MTFFWDFGSQYPANLEIHCFQNRVFELRLHTQSTIFSHVSMFPWAEPVNCDENKVFCSQTQRCINGEIRTATSWSIYMVKSFINAKLHSGVICLSFGLSFSLLSNFVYASGKSSDETEYMLRLSEPSVVAYMRYIPKPYV